jgi:hypothetical protein
MKVIIPENRLEQIIFKYLDVKLKDLDQVKGRHMNIVFKYLGEEYGIIGWNKPDKLYINYKLINNIISFIPIEKFEITRIIGKYVEDKFNLDTTNIIGIGPFDLGELK